MVVVLTEHDLKLEHLFKMYKYPKLIYLLSFSMALTGAELRPVALSYYFHHLANYSKIIKLTIPFLR